MPKKPGEGGPRRIEVEINPRKKIDRIVQTGLGEGEYVEFATIDMSKPEELLKLKPVNFVGSDRDWTILAANVGVERAYSKVFIQFCQKQPPSKEKQLPGGVVHLGETGRQMYKQAKGDWKEYARLMTDPKNLADLTKLGTFGLWFPKTKIDPKKIPDIIEAFL